MNLQDIVRRQLLAHIVSTQITCAVSGDVLDVRNAVVLLDTDGDPAYALSPAGYTAANEAGNVAKLCDAKGWTVDATTLPATPRRSSRRDAGPDQLSLEV